MYIHQVGAKMIHVEKQEDEGTDNRTNRHFLWVRKHV